jgi:hypothetical protein
MAQPPTPHSLNPIKKGIKFYPFQGMPNISIADHIALTENAMQMAGHSTNRTSVNLKGIFLLILCSIVSVAVVAQSQAIDFSKVPSEWVWKKGKVDGQWLRWEPYRKELQRAIPNLPPALEVTQLVFYGDQPGMFGTKARYYDMVLKIKKKVYNSFKKQIEVEGETGCWIYAQVNTLTGLSLSIPGMVDQIRYKYQPDKDELMFVCNLSTETDANGNRVLYASTAATKIQMGHYFTTNKGLPVRQLSWKEFAQNYYRHISAIYADAIRRNKGTTNGEERIKELSQLQKELDQWHAEMMKSPLLDKPAKIESTFDKVDPKKLDVPNGYNIWVNNPAFFDSTKHPDYPQFIILKPRPQLGDASKEAFIDQYMRNMNIDVIAQLAGEKAKKPGGINSLSSSLGTAKNETAGMLSKKERSFDFATGTIGNWPQEWSGNKPWVITAYKNKNWLGLSRAGYGYPKQLGKIEDGFELGFDLEWNKEISYYTGRFAVTLAEVPYDQIAQEFTNTDRNINYNSFYDDVSAGFHRMILYFDPHFNDAGQLEVVISNSAGIKVLSKKVLLPNFYKDKNIHRLRIGRKDGKLWIMDNDLLIEGLDIEFPKNVNYTAFAFSRYRSNNDGEKDIYYLNNISLRYK